MYNEKELNKIIGENIKYYRQIYNIGKSKKDRLTQESLAELADVSTSLIGNIESEKISQGISLHTLYKISCILSVPIEKFFVPIKNKSLNEELVQK